MPSFPVFRVCFFLDEILVSGVPCFKKRRKAFFVCFCEHERQSSKRLVGFKLWSFGEIFGNDFFLMKHTHLCGNITESSEDSFSSIAYDGSYNPSLSLEFPYSFLVIEYFFIVYYFYMQDFLGSTFLEHHNPKISKECGIYKKNHFFASYNVLYSECIRIENLLYGFLGLSILQRELFVGLFAKTVFMPESLGHYCFMSCTSSLVLENITTIFASISLLSSHHTIFFDVVTIAFLADLGISFGSHT